MAFSDLFKKFINASDEDDYEEVNEEATAEAAVEATEADAE